MYSICNGAIRWQIDNFLSDGNGYVCSISKNVRDIRNNNKMPTDLTLKMTVKVKD